MRVCHVFHPGAYGDVYHRLPKVARSLGSTLNEVRKGTRDITDEFDDVKATAKDAQNDVNRSIADLTK